MVCSEFHFVRLGNIESDFIHFHNEDDFSKDAEVLARIALERVLYYCDALGDFQTAEKLLTEYLFAVSNLWGYYHKGILHALTGNNAKSKTYFEQLIASPHDSPWANELKTRTKELLPVALNVSQFKRHIHTIIATSRKLKNLGTYAYSSLWE